MKQPGWGHAQIKVYGILLQLGDATAQDVSQRADMTPANARDILNRMAETGAVTKKEDTSRKAVTGGSPKKYVLNDNTHHKFPTKEDYAANIYGKHVERMLKGLESVYVDDRKTLE